jgi:uracil-DNA glycosylase family 4
MEHISDSLYTSALPSSEDDQRKDDSPSSARASSFACLVNQVQSCRLCPRMEGRTRVFGPLNGSIDTAALFVAEAPGRLGADRWQVPLFGDQTGHAFEELLQIAGLNRQQIFITNAVLCNPRDEHGNNAPPTRQEIENCSQHLRETIVLIQPRYVITLGQVALKALHYLAPHDLTLAQHVGCSYAWYGRWLIPLYHPGSRARVHRPFAMQKEDYLRLKVLLQEHDALGNKIL